MKTSSWASIRLRAVSAILFFFFCLPLLPSLRLHSSLLFVWDQCMIAFLPRTVTHKVEARRLLWKIQPYRVRPYRGFSVRFWRETWGTNGCLVKLFKKPRKWLSAWNSCITGGDCDVSKSREAQTSCRWTHSEEVWDSVLRIVKEVPRLPIKSAKSFFKDLIFFLDNLRGGIVVSYTEPWFC